MWIFIFGLFVGTVGTIIGVGGGFLVVPFLLYFKPEYSASEITSISLFCVTLNAISGSITFLSNKLVHLKIGLLFAAMSIPGAYLGVRLSHGVAREQFELIYACLLTVLALYLFSSAKKAKDESNSGADKIENKYLMMGGLFSVVVGAIASFFGVGGGIIHVPMLHRAIGLSIHKAAATSQFILAITAGYAVADHYFSGTLNLKEDLVFNLAIGMVVGAQFGARYAKKVKSDLVVKLLASTIIMVALRIFYVHYFK